MQQAIAYYRVSTARQGRSGLGIDAQRDVVNRFAAAEGFALAAEFVEVETGKGADALDRRPELAAGLAMGAVSNVRSLWPSWTAFRATWPLWPD